MQVWARNLNQPFLHMHIFITCLQSEKTVQLHQGLQRWSLSPVKLAFQIATWPISKCWLINFHCKTLFLPCCKQLSDIPVFNHTFLIISRRVSLFWSLLKICLCSSESWILRIFFLIFFFSSECLSYFFGHYRDPYKAQQLLTVPVLPKVILTIQNSTHCSWKDKQSFSSFSGTNTWACQFCSSATIISLFR